MCSKTLNAYHIHNCTCVLNSLDHTVKVFLFVGANFHGSLKKCQFVNSWNHGFENSIIQINMRFSFLCESSFVVYQPNNKPQKMVPMNNNTFTFHESFLVKCTVVLKKWTKCPEFCSNFHYIGRCNVIVFFPVKLLIAPSYRNEEPEIKVVIHEVWWI